MGDGEQDRVVVGIDVGGPAKGFHAVAMRGGCVTDCSRSRSASAVAEWCRAVDAQVVAVDAPCNWSTTGRARVCERQLMAKGVWCFSTPTEATAERHPTNHYGWMLNGAELYAALVASHPLATSPQDALNAPVCVETFPHAAVCELSGAVVSAKGKAALRRGALATAGVDTAALTNIDLVDAGLCALVARHVLSGCCQVVGTADEGLIFLPPAAAGHFGA